MNMWRLQDRSESDSVPLLNIETISYELVRRKYFQIEINEKFKEITIINTPVGLLRSTYLPLGIKTSSQIYQKAIEKDYREI